MSTAMASTAAQFQVTTMLRMTPFTQSTVGQTNLSQIGSAGLASVGTTPSGPPLLVGGVDSTALMRRILTDILGSISIVPGLQSTDAEQRFPLQVQEFRTTRGQESTQDILAQVLLELKALTYYMRELPTSIAAMSQFPNPSSMGSPVGMQEEPESLFRDDNVLNNRRG
jgi:hypothetical protein